MTQTEAKPFTVVVAHDFSELSELALAEALALAVTQERAVVHVMAVLDPAHSLDRFGVNAADAEAAAVVQEKLQQHVVQYATKVKPSDFYFYVHARIGSAVDEIVGLAGEVEADLLILGTHGRTGLRRVVLGSVAEAVVRNAQCPVLVMRPKSYDPAERPQVAPEPADPENSSHFTPRLEAKRFAFTRRHQVMPLRPNEWPLW